MNQSFSPHMSHVGHIAHVGNTYVFGLAQHTVSEHRTDSVYLNLAGPVTSVEAVWAALLDRRTVLFQPAGKACSAIRHLRHGGVGSDHRSPGESPYVRFQRRIPGLQIEHLILLDKRFTGVGVLLGRVAGGHCCPQAP